MSLSDLLTPRLVELGAVRIGTLGEERTSDGGKKWRAPIKLDHFIVTQNTLRDDHGQLVRDETLEQRLIDEYADKDGGLRQIPIALLSDNIEDSMKSAYVHYRGRKCFARSDGKTLTKFYHFESEKPLDEPVTADWKPEYLELKHKNAPMFKLHTTLEFVIRVPEARWGGVYRFRTTSVITGDQMYGSLMHLKRTLSGVLTGMPLLLCIRPTMVAPEGKPTVVHVVHVELRGDDLTDLQTRALEMARFHKAHKLEMAALQRDLGLIVSEPGMGEDELEQADVQQEFHPEPPDKGTTDSISELGKSAMPEPVETSAEPEKAVSEPSSGPIGPPDSEMIDDATRKFTPKPDAHPEMRSDTLFDGKSPAMQEPAKPKSEPKAIDTGGVDLDKLPEVKRMLGYVAAVKTEQGIKMKWNQWNAMREEGENSKADALVKRTLDARLAEIEAANKDKEGAN